MAEVALFHSVLGVRPAVLDAADRLRSSGHVVHVCNLYEDGVTFDAYPEAMAYVENMGYPELMRRSREAVADLPAALTYAGFSNGGASAAYLAATRPGATGALLFHAAIPLGAFTEVTGEAISWPGSVPVQVHYNDSDPFREQEEIDAFAADVAASGAPYEYFEYRGAGHLFADAGLAREYDAASAELMWSRALEFLDRVR